MELVRCSNSSAPIPFFQEYLEPSISEVFEFTEQGTIVVETIKSSCHFRCEITKAVGPPKKLRYAAYFIFQQIRSIDSISIMLLDNSST